MGMLACLREGKYWGVVAWLFEIEWQYSTLEAQVLGEMPSISDLVSHGISLLPLYFGLKNYIWLKGRDSTKIK